MHKSCQCQISTDYIYTTSFSSCSAEGLAILKVTVILINDYSSNELVAVIAEWVSSSPAVTMNGLDLTVIEMCETPTCLNSRQQTSSLSTLNSSFSPTVTRSKQESTSVSSTLMIPLIVTAAIVVLAIIIITLAAVFGYKKRKRTSR